MWNPFFCYKFCDGDITHQAFHNAGSASSRCIEWMKRNHAAKQPVFCCCSEDGKHPTLHVCIRGNTTYLRRSPGSHTAHHRRCRNAEASETHDGASNEHVPGIRRQDDDSFQVGLSADLFPARAAQARERVEKIAAAQNETSRDRPSKTYGKSTLLGLLRFLLQETSCIYWSPSSEGKRTAASLSARLERVMSKCFVGGASLLQSAAPFHLTRDLAELKFRIQQSKGGTPDSREFIVIAPLLGLQPPRREGGQFRLALGGTVPTIWIAPSDWERAAKTFNRFLARDDAGSFAQRLWCAVTVRDSSSPQYPSYLRGTNLAAVALTREFIPVDSSWESIFADHLVQERRTFEKPLRFDPSHDMFPDFVLHDTEGETRVEVLGFTDPEYRARIEEKRRLCEQDRIRFLVWDAVNSAPFPLLPPIVHRNRMFR